MSLPNLILNWTFVVCAIFGWTTAANGQDVKQALDTASGLAEVEVTKVEKKLNVDLLPPNLCDPFNHGETLVVSFKIKRTTGHTQKQIFIKIPEGQSKPIKKPLIDPDTVSVGDSYWIAFRKTFDRSGTTENPAGVAGIWEYSEIDDDTAQRFEDMCSDDQFKFQYEYAIHLTDISFGYYDPVGNAEKQFPSIDYLNRESFQLIRHQEEDDSLFDGMLKRMGVDSRGGIGVALPAMSEAKQKRIKSFRELYQTRTDLRNKQLKKLKELDEKFVKKLDRIYDEDGWRDDSLWSSLEDKERADSWEVRARKGGKILWTRKIEGQTRTPESLRMAYSSLLIQSRWLRFIANPRASQAWLPWNFLGGDFKLKQPAPNALCAVNSWEGESFKQYYLNAETGARCIVLTYEFQKPKSNKSTALSALKSVREYSKEDKLVRQLDFVFPGSTAENKAIQLETSFDAEGRILTTVTSTIEAQLVTAGPELLGIGRGF